MNPRWMQYMSKCLLPWGAVNETVMNAAATRAKIFRSARCVFVLWLALSSYSPVQADTYTEAASAFDRSDFQTAYDLLYPLAESGEARAQYELGLLHFQGWRVPGEYRTAHAWIRKSAEQGYAKAQEKLGNLYRIGMVVPQDNAYAYAWFSLAAHQGDSNAIVHLKKLKQLMTSQQLSRAGQLMEEIKRNTKAMR